MGRSQSTATQKCSVSSAWYDPVQNGELFSRIKSAKAAGNPIFSEAGANIFAQKTNF
jgi:hypothetical protein